MVLNTVCAPLSAPQVYAQPPQPAQPAPRLDQIDELIINMVREHGPVNVWPVLDHVVESQGAQSYSERWTARRSLWPRVQRLKRLKLIYGVGRNLVSTTKPVRRQARRRPRERRPGVRVSPGIEGVSAGDPPSPKPTSGDKQEGDLQLLRRCAALYSTKKVADKTKSVADPAIISKAARSLAALPRNPKRRWSGFIGNLRSYRNLPIRLPDGRQVFAFGARRGRVIFTSETDGEIGSVKGVSRAWGVVPAHCITVVKNPAAVTLGRLKAGIRERPSAVKTASARRNGSLPPRPGRVRGRPRNLKTPS